MVHWTSFLRAAAAKPDVGLICLRTLFVVMLVRAWRPVFNPNIRVVSRRSCVPQSRNTVLVHALAMIPACFAVFRIRPLICAGLAAIGVVVAMRSAHRDGRRYERETIRLSFKTVSQDRSYTDQLWIGACVVLGAFWMLSLYLVVRDIFSPTVGPDASILRWIARFILLILSAGGMALYSQRPKGIAAMSE